MNQESRGNKGDQPSSSYYAYRHENGHIFLRIYPDWLEDEAAYACSIGDAEKSPHIVEVTLPFAAGSRSAAAREAYRLLGTGNNPIEAE